MCTSSFADHGDYRTAGWKKSFANATTVTVGFLPENKKILLQMTDSAGKTKDGYRNVDSSIFVGATRCARSIPDDNKCRDSILPLNDYCLVSLSADLDTLNGTSQW